MIVTALVWAVLFGLQAVQAGSIAADDVTDGATSYTTGDGLVTLNALAEGLDPAGVFAVADGALGVSGGINMRINDADGDPTTTADREGIDIVLDGDVGLSSIGFTLSRANGPTSNGIPSGIELSGFLDDPGAGSGTYSNGTLYLPTPWTGSTILLFEFANLDSSTGQTIRVSANDWDEANAQVSIASIEYIDPLTIVPPAGVIHATNITAGASSYTTDDGLVSLDALTIGLDTNGVFGVGIQATATNNSFFGVQGAGNNNAVRDLDGDPATTDDRQAIDMTLDATVGMSEIRFRWSRANGDAFADGTPSGIVISGFTADPGVSTDTAVTSIYTNGAVYLDYSYDAGTIRTFSFSNVVASAGRTLRLSVNDSDQTNAQFTINSITYDTFLVNSALLSIDNAGGQVSVTASNLTVDVVNTLQGTEMLTFEKWVDMASTTGVEQATWQIDGSETNRFFRVLSN